MPTLTLADELVLLAHDDAGTNRLGRPRLDYGLVGAVLLDLALAGWVAVADDRLSVTEPSPTGHPVQDDEIQAAVLVATTAAATAAIVATTVS